MNSFVTKLHHFHRKINEKNIEKQLNFNENIYDDNGDDDENHVYAINVCTDLIIIN